MKWKWRYAMLNVGVECNKVVEYFEVYDKRDSPFGMFEKVIIRMFFNAFDCK